MKKAGIISSIIIIILAGVLAFHFLSAVKQTPISNQATVVSQTAKNVTITYKGENGVDALTLLKQQATIEEDHSGLVVSINGIKPTGHEYWAFYINNKLASVGPAEYKTKNGDIITWKIEKY